MLIEEDRCPRELPVRIRLRREDQNGPIRQGSAQESVAAVSTPRRACGSVTIQNA